MALSVRPAGGTTSVRPAGPLVVARALASRPAGESAADLSLSYLARAAIAASSGRTASASESLAQQALREARADLTRALASLSEPVRALAKFSTDELTRGGTLLRTRVLRTVFAPARDVGLSSAPGPGEGLAGLVRGGYASYPRVLAPAQAPADASFRPYVLLSHSDRTLLSLLYVSAQADGHDLQAVDEVARALLVLRQRELSASGPSVEASLGAPALPQAGFGEPALLEPGAYPSRPPAAGAYPSLPPAPPSTQELEASAQAPWLARSDSYAPRNYGSASGLAARVADSYRSLMPPALPTPSTAPALAEAERTAPQEAASMIAQPRPLDVAEAMGLRALVSSLSSKLQRARRKTRPRRLPQPELAVERDGERGERGERQGRRRAQWFELARRRRERLRAIVAR